VLSLPVLRVLIRELTTTQRSVRTPEPDLVMDDPDSAAAYTRAGREDGLLAAVYVYNSIHICEVIRPGDTVLDLGCGPANQLAQVARLNPDIRFIGIDLSEPMLEHAREHVRSQRLSNVELRHADFTKLDALEDASIDAVMCTMSLHHLPDAERLKQAFAEIARVLKPGGGVYIVDFVHLRSERSIEYFAHEHADRQPNLFTTDYLNSLRAAFSLEDFEQAAVALSNRARLFRALVPILVAFKSPARRDPDARLSAQLVRMKADLPVHQRRDFDDLKTAFRLRGLAPSLAK
jgi:SAM-dependent methyltransferase